MGTKFRLKIILTSRRAGKYGICQETRLPSVAVSPRVLRGPHEGDVRPQKSSR